MTEQMNRVRSKESSEMNRSWTGVVRDQDLDHATHGPSLVKKMFRDQTEAMLDCRGPGPGPGFVLTLCVSMYHCIPKVCETISHKLLGRFSQNGLWNRNKLPYVDFDVFFCPSFPFLLE